jgi:hypothetical protein
MASDASSSDHEDAENSALPDAPLPTIERAEPDPEYDETSSDGLGFLNEELPPLPLNSSDDDLYETSSSDEQDGIEQEEGADGISSVKKSESPPPWVPLKRAADDAGHDSRPFKRARGTAFNHGYLGILNVDIEDAAAQYAPHDEPKPFASQIGLIRWTSVEKELFFEALSRLGRDDIQGISRRIRTKGELEVRQYIKLLQDTASTRQKNHALMPICPGDVPAAVEIGPMCSAALEEAADALASRQESYEESLERERWGDNWLITPFNYRRMEQAAPPNMPSLELFRVSSWLRLPERIFMNANYPENNWQYVSDSNPSIRATALEDFHSLAVSVTKRLVAATIYVAQSRIRAKRHISSKQETKDLVWGKDVEAAALSIGLNPNSDKFWAGCPRRLRLDVYDDESDDDGENDADAESAAGSEAEDGPMTYDEVEAALGGLGDDVNTATKADEESDELVSLSDTPSLDEPSGLDDQPGEAETASKTEEEDEQELDIDQDVLRMDTKELLLYTAQDNPPTTKTRRAAEYRIRSELQHVAYADALDTRVSQREERRLWEMLGREPPDEFVKIKVPERVPHRVTVDDMYPSSGDWRDTVKYVSEWSRSLEDSKGEK